MATNKKHTFLRWVLSKGPRWFRSNWGSRYMGVFGLLADCVAEAARQAVRARYMYRETPSDALDHIGADRDRPRYPDESEAHYRARLSGETLSGEASLSVWDQHLRRTSPIGLREQMLAAGYDVEIVEPKNDHEGTLSFPGVGLRVHGYGRKPCEQYDWPLPDWGSGWAWGTKLPLSVVAPLKRIFLRDAPARARITEFKCPDMRAIGDVDGEPKASVLDLHWRSDEGVATSGSSLTSWEDTLQAAILTPWGSSTYNATDSGFDDQPSISATDGFQSAYSLSGSTNTFTLLFVVIPGSPIGGDQILFRLENGTGVYAEALWSIASSSDKPGVDEDGTTSAFGSYTNVSGLQVIVYVFDENNGAELWVNGVKVDTEAYGGSVEASGGINVLAGKGGADPFNGRVAEIGVMLDRAPTADEHKRIGTVARDYYGATYDGSALTSPWED